ncbi:unnamed protein product [Parascedosporium putredinis]|uniref:Uncharacterized protein n=1 Tax=Parascedosporium putredinis TaxID=1442378 RepID=A0A9P1MDR5_9PEZI|nr:unnamed protein product [Parascedosporium putredinis]CAI7999035.1 unnamed protein product [Parascedosporium putredinis]
MAPNAHSFSRNFTEYSGKTARFAHLAAVHPELVPADEPNITWQTIKPPDRQPLLSLAKVEAVDSLYETSGPRLTGTILYTFNAPVGANRGPVTSTVLSIWIATISTSHATVHFIAILDSFSEG